MYNSNILKFKLSRMNCDALYSSEPFSFEKLQQILKEDFNSQIVSFLQQYYSPSDRGVVNNFNLGGEYLSKSLTNDLTNVECDFIFDVQYYFGCKDIDETDEDQELHINIRLNKNNCTIEIIGDTIFEREPDEY